MKKNIKEINIILLLLMFIIVFKIFLLNKFPNYVETIPSLLLLGMMFILIKFWGFRKERNYYKNTVIRIIIISLMGYLVITYLLGLLTGFSKNVFSVNIVSILKNALPIAVNIISLEIIRFIILRREPNKYQKIFLSLLMVLLNTIIMVNNIPTYSFKEIFGLLTIVILPCIARELLYTYITYNVTILPTLILHLCIELYVFVLPILPSLGNYLLSVMSLLLPFLIYKQVDKCINYREKYGIYAKKYLRNFIVGLIIIIAILILLLVSGIFGYQMIAIGSGSMNPVYDRGDAVIYKKVVSDEIKEGDILVFNYKNNLVTHRVVDIVYKKGRIKYVTKGDNNEVIDQFDVYEENVIGVVKAVVKFIGYPTVLINDKFGG